MMVYGYNLREDFPPTTSFARTTEQQEQDTAQKTMYGTCNHFPYMGQCVHLFAIPNEYNSNGYLPSCNGKADGNYQYRERCDAYYQCDNGIISAVKCPNGTVFDSANKICAVGGKCSK